MQQNIKIKTVGRRCSAPAKRGARCQAFASIGSELCRFHDPGQKDQRIEASRRGGTHGRAAVLGRHTPDIPLDDRSDVVRLIAETISQVRRGELDAKIGNSIGQLLNVALRALEPIELERRVAALELRNGNERPLEKFDARVLEEPKP